MKRCLLILLILGGCAPTKWAHDPPVDDRQFKHDFVRCNAMASQIEGDTDGLTGLAIFRNQQQMCMEGEGYYKDQ